MPQPARWPAATRAYAVADAEVRLRKDDGAEVRVVPRDVPPGSPLAGRKFFAFSPGGNFVTAVAIADDRRVIQTYPAPTDQTVTR